MSDTAGPAAPAAPAGAVERGEPTFVHLTDTHIGPPDARPYGTDTAGNLRAVAERAAQMDLSPAAFVVSGDLADGDDPAAYRHLRAVLDEAFAPFDAPVLLAMGNHDRRSAFRPVFLDPHAGDDEAAPWYHSREVAGVRFVVLDSYLPGRVHGWLGDDQLAWLADELSRPAPLGHVVVIHHPSVPRGVPRLDDYLLLDREAFGAVLTRHRPLAVLCGHSHVATAALFGGTLHVAAPATAYLLDPSIRAGGRAVEGAGFNLCTVREGRLVVNTVILPGAQRELYHHVPGNGAAAQAGALAAAVSRPPAGAAR
jgi:3',5'-cyclic AMP phosphodiesterase CpdA